MGIGGVCGGNGAGLATVKIADGDPVNDSVGEPPDRGMIGVICGSSETGPIVIWPPLT
jgi:hypothetical protein